MRYHSNQDWFLLEKIEGHLETQYLPGVNGLIEQLEFPREERGEATPWRTEIKKALRNFASENPQGATALEVCRRLRDEEEKLWDEEYGETESKEPPEGIKEPEPKVIPQPSVPAAKPIHTRREFERLLELESLLRRGMIQTVLKYIDGLEIFRARKDWTSEIKIAIRTYFQDVPKGRSALQEIQKIKTEYFRQMEIDQALQKKEINNVVTSQTS